MKPLAFVGVGLVAAFVTAGAVAAEEPATASVSCTAKGKVEGPVPAGAPLRVEFTLKNETAGPREIWVEGSRSRGVEVQRTSAGTLKKNRPGPQPDTMYMPVKLAAGETHVIEILLNDYIAFDREADCTFESTVTVLDADQKQRKIKVPVSVKVGPALNAEGQKEVIASAMAAYAKGTEQERVRALQDGACMPLAFAEPLLANGLTDASETLEDVAAALLVEMKEDSESWRSLAKVGLQSRFESVRFTVSWAIQQGH